MKLIKHPRSKRGFYIGRIRQGENHISQTKLSSKMIGTTGRGMALSQLFMTLASESCKGSIVADPKGSFHEKLFLNKL